jgi:hypothetical protein
VASGAPAVLRDGYLMRRAAIEASVPCINNLHLASALAVSVSMLDKSRASHKGRTIL